MLFAVQLLWDKMRGQTEANEEKAWREKVTDALHKLNENMAVLMERDTNDAIMRASLHEQLAQLRRDHDNLRTEVAGLRATVDAIKEGT